MARLRWLIKREANYLLSKVTGPRKLIAAGELRANINIFSPPRQWLRTAVFRSLFAFEVAGKASTGRAAECIWKTGTTPAMLWAAEWPTDFEDCRPILHPPPQKSARRREVNRAPTEAAALWACVTSAIWDEAAINHGGAEHSLNATRCSVYVGGADNEKRNDDVPLAGCNHGKYDCGGTVPSNPAVQPSLAQQGREVTDQPSITRTGGLSLTSRTQAGRVWPAGFARSRWNEADDEADPGGDYQRIPHDETPLAVAPSLQTRRNLLTPVESDRGRKQESCFCHCFLDGPTETADLEPKALNGPNAQAHAVTGHTVNLSICVASESTAVGGLNFMSVVLSFLFVGRTLTTKKPRLQTRGDQTTSSGDGVKLSPAVDGVGTSGRGSSGGLRCLKREKLPRSVSVFDNQNSYRRKGCGH
ncbi:hypothetical protein BIW11_03157 [Tropilaelaps mercedesae]|uniref:Uncharacterized protein n=1 Tax=Tropilaelaps mercedesae TaxID=418985 RepID=A0A1V9XRE8_9ACAR|nr:hypothetical protein BIW11_03157 [Tropilaelaps mercedesae]